MARKRVPLYERLPEIYRIKDGEQSPLDQLKAYLGLFEDVLGSLHENIEQLYHDLFIETCDPWVIPYIGSLLGTTVLAGDPWTLRADVADTIALRRRKGTIGAIELLAFNLTKWGAHCVELRENIAWHQHLNHQRPDAGGAPPYAQPGVTRNTVVRGGTVTLRDPAMLSLRGTPFGPRRPAHQPAEPGHLPVAPGGLPPPGLEAGASRHRAQCGGLARRSQLRGALRRASAPAAGAAVQHAAVRPRSTAAGRHARG